MNTYSNLTNEQRNEIDKAIKLVNIKDIRELSYGEDLELTSQVCLSQRQNIFGYVDFYKD